MEPTEQLLDIEQPQLPLVTSGTSIAVGRCARPINLEQVPQISYHDRQAIEYERNNEQLALEQSDLLNEQQSLLYPERFAIE